LDFILQISYHELKETEETREYLSSAGLRAEDLTPYRPTECKEITPATLSHCKATEPPTQVHLTRGMCDSHKNKAAKRHGKI